MPEADVLYSRVKFKRAKGNASGTASSSDEPTYSEVKISTIQPPSELPEVSQQQAAPNGGSKVTSEKVAVVVLSVLLAAAVIALGVITFAYLKTNRHFETLRDEHEAVKRNLTALLTEMKQHTCPSPPEGKTNEMCPKCGVNWEQHGGKCYYFSTNALTWSESRAECRCNGGDLVKIDSREEQEFLERKLTEKMKFPEDKFWIGLTDYKKERTWLWVDGSTLSLAFWSGREPDNWKGENPDGEDCVRMGHKTNSVNLNSWFDKSCKRPHRAICEKKAKI